MTKRDLLLEQFDRIREVYENENGRTMLIDDTWYPIAWTRMRKGVELYAQLLDDIDGI